MRVSVEHDGKRLHVDSDVPISINKVLERLGIHPSTVLAVHGETIVPHTSVVSDDLEVTLIVVSSGG